MEGACPVNVVANATHAKLRKANTIVTIKRHAPLTQMAEYHPFKLGVLGSNPRGRTEVYMSARMFTPKQVIQIRELRAKRYSYKEIAVVFNTSVPSVHRIC